MQFKEELYAPDVPLSAEIYKLDGCKCYWIKFLELLPNGKKQFLTVRVIAELKEYSYNDIKKDILTKYFAEVMHKSEHSRIMRTIYQAYKGV